MSFIAPTVLASVESLLSADTSFYTIGYSEINYSEDESVIKPIVQAHISGGDFSQRGSGVRNKFQHQFTIQFDIISSAASEFDLSVIENPASTPSQISTAIASGRSAARIAHEKAYSVCQSVFNVINGITNLDLGMPAGTIKSRDFGEYKADNTTINGNFATVFFVVKLNLIIEETVTGLTPVESEEPPVSGVIDGDLPD